MNADDNMDCFMNSSDWSYIFENFVYDPNDCTKPGHPVRGHISRDDVAVVICLLDGMNDEEPWYGLFKLNNGMYLYVEAWCDYTGWG